MAQAGRTALQAQQYAEIDANTLRLLDYDDLDANGAHARRAITSVADAEGWQDEIKIGEEKTINGDSENKQKIATIKIYKEGDTLSRYSLQVPLSTQGNGDSGVPIGTIITWPLASLPSHPESGKWLECNGQYVNPSLYPKLANLMSYTPDYRGYFLRGEGGNSDTLGVAQSDAIRNIWGKIDASSSPDSLEAFGEIHPNFLNITGAFEGIYSPTQAVSDAGSVAYRMTGFYFDASKIVPTATENRPINKSVRYLIKAK